MDTPSDATPRTKAEAADDDAQSPSLLDRFALDLVGLAGIAALVVGTAQLSGGELGFEPGAVLAALGSTLPETLPAALLVLAAVALNVLAGAVVARVVLGVPFRSLVDLVLVGFAAAVLLDLVALVVLGGLGVYHGVVLLALLLLPAVLARRAQPLLVRSQPAPGASSPAGRTWPSPGIWAFLLVAWSSPFLLQLASPVVPFTDVLPNHVAPAEHLRTFGSWSELTLTQSPIYGPSRSFLGYTAFTGAITSITGLPASLAVAALVLPGSILVAAGAYRLATALGGPGAGTWALVTVTLTTSFARLADARATVLVLPLALLVLAVLVDRLRTAPRTPTTTPADDGAGPRPWLLVGGGLGAALLVHPVIGALAFVTAGLAVIARPTRLGPPAIPGLVGAAVLAMIQVATMLGVALPTLAALPVLVLAPAAGWLVARLPRVQDVLVLLGRAALVYGSFVVVYVAVEVVKATLDTLTGVLTSLPLLVLLSVLGVVVTRRRVASPVVVAALIAAAIAAGAAGLSPAGDSLTGAIRFEMGKTLQYWIPVVLAITAALAIDAVWRRVDLATTARLVFAGGIVVASALPLRPEPIDRLFLGERRLGETMSQAMHWVQVGYWRGYPDPRRVVDGPRRELLDAVRAEIDAGRIRADTEVLHVARSFQQWVAAPLGVFTGVIETMASVETEVSIHTAGGRLHPIEDLDALLASGAFGYVVLEPDGDVPPDARDRIIAAGFVPVFANGQGEVFRAASAP